MRALVVDDSAMSRRMMRRILEDAGHSVVEASTGLAALESYSLERPDVTMLDLVMPDLTGLEVLIQLRRLDDTCAVVVVTADIQFATRDEALAAGAHAFLGKPYVPEAVLAALASVTPRDSGARGAKA